MMEIMQIVLRKKGMHRRQEVGNKVVGSQGIFRLLVTSTPPSKFLKFLLHPEVPSATVVAKSVAVFVRTVTFERMSRATSTHMFLTSNGDITLLTKFMKIHRHRSPKIIYFVTVPAGFHSCLNNEEKFKVKVQSSK